MSKGVAAGLLSIAVVTVAYLVLHTASLDWGQPVVPAIIAPLDGAAVKGPVKVQIQYAGSGSWPGGHVHVLIDVEPPKPGELVPMDEQHLHLMNFETETVIDLSPGEHRLQLLLGTPDHRVSNPPVLSKSVKITVLPKG